MYRDLYRALLCVNIPLKQESLAVRGSVATMLREDDIVAHHIKFEQYNAIINMTAISST